VRRRVTSIPAIQQAVNFVNIVLCVTVVLCYIYYFYFVLHSDDETWTQVLVFSVFTSRPTSLLLSVRVAVLNWAPRYEGVLGSGGIALRILDLGTSWWWSASRPGCFNPREKAPGTHWIGGWVGPRAGLDTVNQHISTSAQLTLRI
jgi:hypothetical protein